ncbi:HD-GYP domain-containing protein [Thermosipho sp. (in: thermotogales)]|uniref:HD-GYP domain-containing protein n=1 Tax=Thermosipho sp. (in: thermotogales) TaxID=1968895 RepID=UPI00257C9050|nr:HD-GYP domain-containing protein [Thermosipho sp. (in: thermotogales)]MBZ4650679.1 hdig domain protein [Thermosipho sp. (in: thermotogales)]MDK2840303.1 hypothetical protein [Thermosipho sp. (in: thermotogales)]MDK2900808.1 hypothetical protein [Thermosipho sp. (in: thermotogales)]
MAIILTIVSVYAVVITALFLKKSLSSSRYNIKSLIYDFNDSLSDSSNDFSSKVLSFISKNFSKIDSGAIFLKNGKSFIELNSFGNKIENNDKIFFYKDYYVKEFFIDESYALRTVFHTIKNLSKEEKEKIEILTGLISSSEIIKNLIKKNGKFQIDLMLSMIKILEYYDRYTQGHSMRVAEFSKKIAEKMKLSHKEISDAYWTGLVHDIGKIAIPTGILNKEGKLTNEEFAIIKKHPVYGYEFLSTSETLKDIATYVFHHHERWDGNGYPTGLKGEMIPIISRIIAVADSWDAMISKRAYRNALPKDYALQEIINNSGKQFDPRVVKAFLEVIEEEEDNISIA